MFINENHISEYSAKLLSRKISPLQIEVSSFWPKKALLPFISTVKGYYYKKLEIELELTGSPKDIEVNKSRLIKALTSASVAFKVLDHIYTGIIDNTGIGGQEYGFEVLNLSMLVYEHNDPQEVEINRSLAGTIHIDSNHVTPAVIELRPSIDLPSLTLTGFESDITLSNLSAGTLVVLDGEKGLITQNGVNKWLEYDSWGFPVLTPGENNITLSSDTLDMTVRFSPRWA